MRYRIWVGIGLAMLLVAMASCAGGRSNQGPVGTPIPTKTLRPTFTHTPPKPAAPTATPVPPTAAVVSPPTATPEPPTPTTEPPTETPVPTPAAFTVTSATLNVRSGPGTNYPVVAKLSRGQTFEITGKNPAGDWWQFPYKGQSAWVSAGMVNATDTEAVEVAENIPAPPPTAKPQPRPQPPAPKPPAAAPPPSASYRYTLRNAEPRVNMNDWITVWCRVARNISTGAGDSGTMRVLRGSEVLKEQAFQPPLHTANAGMGAENQFLYNQDCKVEIRPPIEGTYTAYLIEGGQQISEPASFTVSGDNREFVIRWQPR